jgi:hypothetical protein
LPTGAIPTVTGSEDEPAKIAGNAQHRADSPVDGADEIDAATAEKEGEQK